LSTAAATSGESVMLRLSMPMGRLLAYGMYDQTLQSARNRKLLAAETETASRPVSRVLYGPPHLAARRTWRPFVLDRRCRRPHATYPDGELETAPRVAPQPPLFGLAPGGVCPAAPVASRAVGSYPTLSPLPRKPWRFAFCGTFPGVAPAGH